jgi:hypothetical protein
MASAVHLLFKKGNILQVLKENGLTTFLELVIKADLAETLLGMIFDFYNGFVNSIKKRYSYT